jgi:hypothetical protein
MVSTIKLYSVTLKPISILVRHFKNYLKILFLIKYSVNSLIYQDLCELCCPISFNVLQFITNFIHPSAQILPVCQLGPIEVDFSVILLNPRNSSFSLLSDSYPIFLCSNVQHC